MNATSDQGKKTTNRRPAISAIGNDGTLIELIYDSVGHTTAFAICAGKTWTIEKEATLTRGRRLVPFSPDNNLIKNEAVLLAAAPEEYGSEEDLLSEVQVFLHRYIDMSETFERLAAHYVLFSWVYDVFNEVPYLRLRGDFGTGKTRGLLVIGSVCYKAFFASGASTVSPIFHTLDAFRGTLILDEADFRFSDEKAEIVKILNNGNAKGMPVLRTVVTNNREFNPRAFHVYGPKIVATRGTYNDRALESRFITEETGGRPLRADIPINMPPEWKAEALSLRNKLLLYRFRNRQRIRLDASLADAAMEPRLNQILIPLLSTIGNPTLRDDLRNMAAANFRDLAAEREFSPEGRVLEILLELAETRGMDDVSVQAIATSFNDRYGAQYHRPITPKWIGQILRTKLRLPTYKSRGVYLVATADAGKLSFLRTRYGQSHQVAQSDSHGEQPRLGLGDVGTL